MKSTNGIDQKRQTSSDSLIAKVDRLMQLPGETGLTVKVGLLAGLNQQELLFVYCSETCQKLGMCSCFRLHASQKGNGVTIMDLKGKRPLLVPTALWQNFRNILALGSSDVVKADKAMQQSIGIRRADLAGIYRRAMLSDDEKMTKILVGDASPVEVKCSLLFEQDKLIDCYRRGWERVGVVLPIV